MECVTTTKYHNRQKNKRQRSLLFKTIVYHLQKRKRSFNISCFLKGSYRSNLQSAIKVFDISVSSVRCAGKEIQTIFYPLSLALFYR